MHLEPYQWAYALSAALIVGVSKTGVPGVGILVVPMLAAAFGGRLSIGIMLPMLICGDIFAVTWYRRHAQWDKLLRLLPWVVFGMIPGAIVLVITGDSKSTKDYMGVILGAMVLLMIALQLLRGILGDRLTPTSKVGTAATGTAAGFATTVSNAAGPIMQMYLTAVKMPKEQFMGTIAWYFFLINTAKFPLYVLLSVFIPQKPIVTWSSLGLNAMVAPLIILGAFIGKWLLPRIPQKWFEIVIISLAAAGGLKLLFMR
jgi:uncharacterized membrane protein YfcA